MGYPYKFEAEAFQQLPQFQFTQTPTPVETKPDPYVTSVIAQLSSQIQQLQLAVSQIHQVVVGQSFTQAAGLPQAAATAPAKLKSSKKAAAGG